MTFGKKLEIIMKKYKIRVKDLSIACDITEGYISDIKKGRSLPREDKMLRILENLNISSEEKENLKDLWEKETSPKSFVAKFENLENQNQKLKEMINSKYDNNTFLLLENKEKEIKKLKEEKVSLEKYKKLLLLLSKEDLKYTLNRIIKDIEYNLKENNSYEENKFEIEELKKEVLELIK